MKLKLSTLVVIIGIIFFAYYYIAYSPCQTPAGEEVPPMLVPPGEEGVAPEEEVTMLENFGVTSIDEDNYEPDYYEPTPQSSHMTQSAYSPDTVYDLAGNVRPDNVMHVEPVTLL